MTQSDAPAPSVAEDMTALLARGTRIESRFRALPSSFYADIGPEAVGVDPLLVHLNEAALPLAGLLPEAGGDPGLLQVLSGHRPIKGTEPFAGAYAGHQFGSLVPQLGDGRAVTIMEGRRADDEPFEIQLKGAGRTPFSRFGDGRAVLRSCLREYLCSEHMHALGIPTTRALSVMATREGVQRETLEPGAVMARVARSHLRFGHIEFAHYRDDTAGVKAILDHALEHHFPEEAAALDPPAALFRTVVERTAELVAGWQAAGFAHGVMNTDNMSLLGLTIDYGPFGFLETFDPGFICNHTDQTGRYAFGRQPEIGFWNVKALAAALSTVVDMEHLTAGLERFGPAYEAGWLGAMAAKIGILPDADRERASALVRDLLQCLYAARTDYTVFFRSLTRYVGGDDDAMPDVLTDNADGRTWVERWTALRRDAADAETSLNLMKAANPAFVLRNWVAETAIRAVEDDLDLDTLDRIFRLATSPFDQPTGDSARFAAPAPPEMRNLSVSCSS